MGRRGDLDFNAVLWFLPTLFCVELIYYLIKKLLKNYFFIVPFVICIAFAFHCFFNNSKWLWGLDNAGYYVLYFALGDIFSRFLTEKKVMNILCGVSSIILVIVFCNVSYWTNIVATTEELHVTVRSSIDIVLAIIGILGIVGIAKGLSNNMILSNIGRYSLPIMVYHVFIIEGIAYLFMAFGWTVNQASFSYCVFVTILSISLICIFKKLSIKNE